MIFVDGVYHADPHPGNILVRPDGSIVFLDFGAVGVLSPQMKEGIPAFLEGLIARDPRRVRDAMHQMRFVARSVESGDVADRVIEYFQRRFFDQVTIESWNLGSVQVDMKTKLEAMADLSRLDVSFRDLTSTFQVPKDWVLLERTLLLLLGLCTHLDPSLNPMRTIKPYLEEFVLGGDRDWVGLVRSTVREMVLSSLTIPDNLQRFLAQANRGEIQVRVPDLQVAARLIYTGMRQFLYGLAATGSGIVWFFARSAGEVTIAWWAGVVSMLAAATLLVSLIRSRSGD
jgi:ubiquinone biosynthesis protein